MAFLISAGNAVFLFVINFERIYLFMTRRELCFSSYGAILRLVPALLTREVLL
jgi:hypothetical protein